MKQSVNYLICCEMNFVAVAIVIKINMDFDTSPIAS